MREWLTRTAHSKRLEMGTYYRKLLDKSEIVELIDKLDRAFQKFDHNVKNLCRVINNEL